MDIKERFYANLNMIREDWEKDAAGDVAFSKNAIKKLKASIGKTKRPYVDTMMDIYHWDKFGKKANNKAVTGMDEEAEQIDEKAKWRKNPRAIASKEDPHEWGNSEHDDYYGWEAPRSTGRMKAKGDTPYSDGSLMNRRKSEISTRGERKGKITKSSAARLKDRIKTNLKK